MPRIIDSFARRSPVRDRASRVMESRTPDRKERQFIEHVLRIPMHRFTDQKAYLEAGCKKVWASFRACHITASILLTTVFKVQGQKAKLEVTDPDLTRLLTSPNPFDTWAEMLYMWVYHMKLTGQAFWYKDRMDYRGRPKYLYPLLPQYVGVVPHPEKKIDWYEYRVNGRTIRFEPEEIIHFRRPHPMDLIKGLGDVEGGEALFSGSIMRSQLEQKFLENGAMPSGILTKEEAVESEQDWGKLKAWWKAEYEGPSKVGKTAFLNGKWNYVRLGLTGTEMQSIEQQRWDVNEIFTLHGVPLSLAGIDRAANFATAKQDEINFRKYEIVPLLELLVGKLNSAPTTGTSGGGIIYPFSPQWELVYELSGLIDIKQVQDDYGPLVDRGGMTLNQLRELCGLPRDENNPLLDQYFINSSRVPIELAGLSGATGMNEGATNNAGEGGQP